MGLDAEEMIEPIFDRIFHPILKRIIYDPKDSQSINLQNSGIDGIIKLEEFSFETKSRDFKYHKDRDILLETISIVENQTLGWLYSCKAPFIVYVWFNRQKTRFVDGYILNMSMVHLWVLGRENEFRKRRTSTNRNGMIWHTEFILVPINWFPVGCLQQIAPYILRKDEQSKLDRFFEWNNGFNSDKINLGDFT